METVKIKLIVSQLLEDKSMVQQSKIATNAFLDEP